MSVLPLLADIVAGSVIFWGDMPIWCSRFGDNIWRYIEWQSPEFEGPAHGSIIWSDYIHGRGATLDSRVAKAKSTYEYCLTPEIIQDLKVAAVIHGLFPRLLKDARRSKEEIDPATVKGRIDELAKFFSLVIREGERQYGYSITRLNQIPFQLLKEAIAVYPGRAGALKRALKLISDSMVQRNLSAPLQWGFLDITKSALAWRRDEDGNGIQTLSDTQFLFLLDAGKRFIAQFKRVAGMEIYDSECRGLAQADFGQPFDLLSVAFNSYYDDPGDNGGSSFISRYGVPAEEVATLIRNAHASALMLILLLTGMRSSETKFVMRGALNFKWGYWFIDSKVIKGRPKKGVPISEGWLAIDITRDAFDVLSWVCQKTGNPYVFSSAVYGKAKGLKPYRGGALNTKLIRWIKSIDRDSLFLDWKFSIHQCRETLVSQLAKQNIGMPFLSMQLKHFHSQLNNMPNAVTAQYGEYRSQLMLSVTKRIAKAKESALLDVYGDEAKFAGGGGAAHKARIDAFFSGLGLFGEARKDYIKLMARRGVKLMPTSIGCCTKNFIVLTEQRPPPCYGDYQCDPDCKSHVITERCARALAVRKEHALAEAAKEPDKAYRTIWLGLAERLDSHVRKLGLEGAHA